MNSRRNFIIKGSIATSALLAAKPFQAIAGISSQLTGLSKTDNQLVFLHTADMSAGQNRKAMQFISSVKEDKTNVILLHTGNGNAPQASVDINTIQKEQNADYQIIDKGGLRTGIISALPGDNNVVIEANRLSAFLKKEKNCQVVVCMSQLGFKNSNSKVDDVKLAEASLNIDIIISGHTQNFSPRPVVVANKKRQEVIIHASAGTEVSCGKIEMGFDVYGAKNSVVLANKLSPFILNRTKNNLS